MSTSACTILKIVRIHKTQKGRKESASKRLQKWFVLCLRKLLWRPSSSIYEAACVCVLEISFLGSTAGNYSLQIPTHLSRQRTNKTLQWNDAGSYGIWPPGVTPLSSRHYTLHMLALSYLVFLFRDRTRLAFGLILCRTAWNERKHQQKSRSP